MVEEGERSLSGLDARILQLLISDCRRSYRDIAYELKVSPSTVMNHIKELIKNGVIRGFSAIIDHEKLGYEITAITEIIVSKGKLIEMEKEIAKIPNVCAVYDVTGEIDGIVIAKFHDREELSNFTKKLLAMPFIERTNTHVVLTTVREDFRLPPL